MTPESIGVLDMMATLRLGAEAERRLLSICCMRDRAHLFCDVLSVLAEDLFQPGREAMALSLLDYATSELAQMLAWDADDLAPLLEHRYLRDDDVSGLLEECVARQHELSVMLPAIVAGLEAMIDIRLPPDPVAFAIDVVRFVAALKAYLRRQEHLLPPVETNTRFRRDSLLDA
jgi:hypothetical protein